jgi:hypothetical protein
MAAVGFYGQFVELAFGRASLPDHPIRTVKEAQKALSELPADPAAALAELTHSVAAMNAIDAFTPGRRARILMTLDDAARPFWAALGSQSLAPGGRPNEGRDGDPQIIRALYDSCSEFSNGYVIALSGEEGESKWLDKNRPRVLLRHMRWFSRRYEFAHMLRLPVATRRKVRSARNTRACCCSSSPTRPR